MQKRVFVLYTDGSCLDNGSTARSASAGVGVWHERGSRFNVSESWSLELGKATNQRAEIYAAIRALEVTSSECQPTDEIIIRTDSRYVVGGVTEWMPRWKRIGWKNARGNPVSNADLWQRLDDELSSHPAGRQNVKWQRVSGHSGDVGNDMADSLARKASDRQRPRGRDEESSDDVSSSSSEPNPKRSKLTDAIRR